MRLQKLKKLKLFKNETLLSLEKLEKQGFCNTNYKLHTSKKIYLVRVFKSDDTVNISRKHEFKIQKKAWKKGFAPKPLYLEKDFMITKFEKGSHKKELSIKEVKKLIGTIKKLHKIKSKVKVHNLEKDFKQYKKILKDKSSQKLIKKSLNELKKISKSKEKKVTTHHDLNPLNILFHKNSIKILDWEYTGKNSPYFDLASICVEFKLDKKKQRKVLEFYFGDVKSFRIKELESFILIYKNLCKSWNKYNLI